MNLQKIRIKLKAYDHRLLDTSVGEIVDTVTRTGAHISGPIPLPTTITRYTVLRSTFIDKKSREQYEIRTHKRVVYITETTGSTIDVIGKVVPPRGVDLNVKLITESA